MRASCDTTLSTKDNADQNDERCAAQDEQRGGEASVVSRRALSSNNASAALGCKSDIGVDPDLNVSVALGCKSDVSDGPCGDTSKINSSLLQHLPNIMCEASTLTNAEILLRLRKAEDELKMRQSYDYWNSPKGQE